MHTCRRAAPQGGRGRTRHSPRDHDAAALARGPRFLLQVVQQALVCIIGAVRRSSISQGTKAQGGRANGRRFARAERMGDVVLGAGTSQRGQEVHIRVLLARRSRRRARLPQASRCTPGNQWRAVYFHDYCDTTPEV
jgi:hypothetical protein